MSERHTGAITQMSWRELGCSLGIIALVFLGVFIVVVLPMMFRFRNDPQAHRVSCANNLKQIGLAMKMYANESKGELYPRQMYYYDREVDCDDVAYPPVGEPVANLEFMFNFDDMYPEYLPDLAVLVCPETIRDSDRHANDVLINPTTGALDIHHKCADPDRGWHMADDSYWYLSHMLTHEKPGDQVMPYSAFKHLGRFCADDAERHDVSTLNAQMAAWFEVALKQMEEAPSEFFEVMEEDLDAESLGIREGAVLFRLRYGVERYTALGPSIPEDHVLQAAIPMVYDVPSPMEEHTSHEKRGGNVLFMDGHVEFVAYPKGFPFYPGVAWISECIRTGRGD